MTGTPHPEQTQQKTLVDNLLSERTLKMTSTIATALLVLWLAAVSQEIDGARLSSLSNAVHALHDLPNLWKHRDHGIHKASAKTAAAEADRVTELPGLDALDSALFSG